jgi:hypothetical protein
MAKVLFEFGVFIVLESCVEYCAYSKSDMLVPDIGIVLAPDIVREIRAQRSINAG